MNHLEFLKEASRKGKLSHAYLLSGNDMEKQKTLARDFLSFLMGYKEKTLHPDITFVRAEKGVISIGQIRNLRSHLSLSPWQSSWKVGIIEQAELMNQQAQSAFLKLLEEPKGNSLLFLLSLHPALLLDTIRSRAQELRLNAFPEKPFQGTLDLEKLEKLSFAERFEQAKILAEDEEGVAPALLDLMRQARARLLASLDGKEGIKTSRYRSVIAVMQEVLQVLRDTQGNPRLAVERVFLYL